MSIKIVDDPVRPAVAFLLALKAIEDTDGTSLAFVYFDDRIARDIAKLPDPLRQ